MSREVISVIKCDDCGDDIAPEDNHTFFVTGTGLPKSGVKVDICPVCMDPWERTLGNPINPVGSLVACTTCGFVAKTPAGLAVHVARRHK